MSKSLCAQLSQGRPSKKSKQKRSGPNNCAQDQRNESRESLNDVSEHKQLRGDNTPPCVKWIFELRDKDRFFCRDLVPLNVLEERVAFDFLRRSCAKSLSRISSLQHGFRVKMVQWCRVE